MTLLFPYYHILMLYCVFMFMCLLCIVSVSHSDSGCQPLIHHHNFISQWISHLYMFYIFGLTNVQMLNVQYSNEKLTIQMLVFKWEMWISNHSNWFIYFFSSSTLLLVNSIHLIQSHINALFSWMLNIIFTRNSNKIIAYVLIKNYLLSIYLYMNLNDPLNNMSI